VVYLIHHRCLQNVAIAQQDKRAAQFTTRLGWFRLGRLNQQVVVRSTTVRALDGRAMPRKAKPMEIAPIGAHLLRLIENTTPVRTHIARIAAPEFSGNELARIRLSLELSIDEVAYLASVTPWQLRYMEEGSSNIRYRPSFEVLNSVKAALHFHIMRRLKKGEGVAPERRPGRSPPRRATQRGSLFPEDE
jgi:hypothetical protein